MLVLALIVIFIELIPAVKKKQGREAIVLLLLGTFTLVYGYYYNTRQYSASLVKILLGVFNVQ